MANRLLSGRSSSLTKWQAGQEARLLGMWLLVVVVGAIKASLTVEYEIKGININF